MDEDTSSIIIKVLGCVLEKLCANNRKVDSSKSALTKFHSMRPPTISIASYLERIHKYAACSGESFILALIYIDRLIQRSNFVLTHLNVHRVIITSVTLAAKFFDDQYYNNAYYARVGGLPCAEMNSLEIEFLFLTNFTLFVSPTLFRQYTSELLGHVTSEAHLCEVCFMAAPPVSSVEYLRKLPIE